MDTPNFSGPVTTASNPQRLVPLGTTKRKVAMKAVKKVIKKDGKGGPGPRMQGSGTQYKYTDPFLRNTFLDKNSYSGNATSPEKYPQIKRAFAKKKNNLI